MAGNILLQLSYDHVLYLVDIGEMNEADSYLLESFMSAWTNKSLLEIRNSCLSGNWVRQVKRYQLFFSHSLFFCLLYGWETFFYHFV